MVSQISAGVEVSVEAFYQHDYSNPAQGLHMFAYRITIENLNNFPIRLKRRHWFIFDSGHDTHEVEGEGVVGMQPTIDSGGQYQYSSACHLNSEIGRMTGTYLMENLYNKQEFIVSIPSFDLVVPFKHN